MFFPQFLSNEYRTGAPLELSDNSFIVGLLPLIARHTYLLWWARALLLVVAL